MAKSKLQAAGRKRRSLALKADKRVPSSEKLARQLAYWHKRLAPKYPDIDPHDLDLIIVELLKSRKERMELMFLKRREDGVYVF